MEPKTEPTPANKKAVQLLDKYKCSQCNKFKHNACFSKKQLNTYTYKKAAGQSVNAVTARLRCIVCVGGNCLELKCQGPCGTILSINDFSKQARSNGGSSWCKNCTAWKEAAEPGVTTLPAVTSDVAPDEQDIFATATTYDEDAAAFSDPEAGAGSDDDYDYPSYGYPGTAASDFDATSSAGVRTNYVAVPYHGLGALSLSGASESQTENSRPVTRGPPSSGFAVPYQGLGALSLSAPSESQTQNSRPVTRGTPSNGFAGNARTFNAFDPQGNPHVMQRAPSSITLEASNATAVPKTSNWAKPTGRRVEPKMTNPVAVPRRRRGYESDSGEDEM